MIRAPIGSPSWRRMMVSIYRWKKNQSIKLSQDREKYRQTAGIASCAVEIKP
jgi:hypothetical protein